MIKTARVVSQKSSIAKKGLYITVLNDGLGELRAYASRKLEVGQEVVISLKQGAANDPLSTTILNKKQEEAWRQDNGAK